MQFPQYAVSRWIGHSITVSGKHYANAVPDELFDKASGTPDPGKQAAQNQAQHAAEAPRTGSQEQGERDAQEANNPAGCGALRHDAISCDDQWSRGELNPRPETANRPPLHAYSLL
jgi:hypothetical protein